VTRSLIASRTFTPEVNAAAFRLGALARALARDPQDDVIVVTTRPGPHAPKAPDPSGMAVDRWPVLRDSGGNVRGYLQYASFDVPLLARILFRRWDVAVAESPPTTGIVVAVATALRRCRFVYYAADVWTDGVISMGAPAPVVTVMRSMERFVLRRAGAILSVSDEVTDRLIALGADPDRVTVVGNGIDTDIFSPEVAPAAADRYFVYTGTMSEWQRPDVFVRGFAQLAEEFPDVRVRFFGQGAVEGEVRRVAEQLVPGRVEFGGVVTPSDSARWIRGAVASLVSIAPGIGYDFARPTKTYAAAACGTPVLFAGAPVGGALVRDNGLGEAVEFTPDAVAAAMRRLLAAASDGETERLRASRAAWAVANVSLSAAGERAAEAVRDLVNPTRPAK
jgi:glycosyltransferase involved in cell wall biosynthesis